MPGIENKTTVLTPELARINPEFFKSLLLESLKSQTLLGAKIWDTLCKRQQVSLNGIKLNSDTIGSGYNLTTGEITLGVGSWSKELASKIIFEDSNFQGTRQYIYRLMHELSHIIGLQLGGAFEHQGKEAHVESTDLINVLHNLREDGHHGITMNGNREAYIEKGIVYQVVEDHAELLNMFAIDPSYLKRYLLFLADPKYTNFRNQNNLTTLSLDTAEHIYQVIKSSVEFFLK